MSTHTHTPMLGNARKFYIGTGTGTISYTWLAGEQNNSVTLNGNAIEVSDRARVATELLSLVSLMELMTASKAIPADGLLLERVPTKQRMVLPAKSASSAAICCASSSSA